MSKNNILFSVIIPVYKRLELAKEAINSVIDQVGVPEGLVEIIVSDDEDNLKKTNSNKKFFKKISKKVIYLRNLHKEGPGGNRQTGLSKARGRFIVFLDSDDRMTSNFLSEMSKRINNNSVAAVCLSKSYFEKDFRFLEKLKLIPLIIIRDAGLLLGLLFNSRKLFNSSFYLCQISHMMFLRRAINNQKFNYNYRHGGEDWDFFVQTLKKGKIAIVPKRLLLFRYSPGSSTDEPINRQRKWSSYSLLAKKLPNQLKKGIFYKLFLGYIGMFRVRSEKK